MKLRNVQHPILTEDHPLAPFLWLSFCVLIWALGIVLTVVIIESLYFR